MRWTSIAAIFILFWTISLFLVLPFGVRTAEEAGVERLPGHADSAPHQFSLPRAAFRASIVAAVLFGCSTPIIATAGSPPSNWTG